jgi:hypothetical protein
MNRLIAVAVVLAAGAWGVLSAHAQTPPAASVPSSVAGSAIPHGAVERDHPPVLSVRRDPAVPHAETVVRAALVGPCVESALLTGAATPDTGD